MSKDECISYLSTHPGKWTNEEIAVATKGNISSCRRCNARLAKDGMIKSHYDNRKGPILYEAIESLYRGV
jgi:hypothetical protein